MPKRVKSDETASRTMSIMPTAAFIRPGDAPKRLRPKVEKAQALRRAYRSFRREPSSEARTRRERQRARGTEPFQMSRFAQDSSARLI